MINEHDIKDNECALYELRKGDKFKIVDDDLKVPVAHDEVDLAAEYLFGHIDGMYSYCKDMTGNVVHFAAWTKVKKVENESSARHRDEQQPQQDLVGGDERY